ncbi:hypothetical protein CFIMG_007203RA00001 [Ceratocystis fimbriata CBS 114723]|uniref:NYN domain-containing protein n=1 Tax=Ceratocystis fimbriata CBS 114723 TaxID=1035309 RepID=A0A2C5XMV1_9PEZI|nr:hypothetical protein CFIMG_007203RA00001 [Ceratocystis fimbriata CBS 114723]
MTPPVSPVPATTTPLLGDFSAVQNFLQQSICQRDSKKERKERPQIRHQRSQRSQCKDPPANRASSSSSPSPRYDHPKSCLENLPVRSPPVRSPRRSPFSPASSRAVNPSLVGEDLRESFRSSPPPSHSATQRIKSRTSSGAQFDIPQDTKRHGNFGPAIANYLERLPDTPAPTPPPPYSSTLQGQAPSHTPVQPFSLPTSTSAATTATTVVPSNFPPSSTTSSTASSSSSSSASASASSSTKKTSTPPITILQHPVANVSSPPKKEKKKKLPSAEASSGVSLNMSYPSRSPTRHPGADIHISASGSLPKSAQFKTYLRSLKKSDASWTSSIPSAARPLHVFVDMSNIIIGCYDACKSEMGLPKNQPFPTAPSFNFSAFNKVLCRSRPVARCELAGSTSKPNHWPSYAIDAKKAHYDVHILNRTVTDVSKSSHSSGSKVNLGGREQCVDELLHLKMAQSVLDEELPGVMVLATGDANAAQFSDGFLMAVERALKRGWAVEVVSWSETMSHAWLDDDWCAQWEGRFRTIELDPFLAKFVGQEILRPTAS